MRIKGWRHPNGDWLRCRAGGLRGVGVETSGPLEELRQQVVECRRCPRLVAWREQVAREKRAAFRDQTYWGRPVPGFGDPAARLLILGLAPAAHGGNRTGRIFTGDRSGDWLFASLWRTGFANQPNSVSRDDGLELADCYITAPVKCAPPDNKPLPAERASCAPWLDAELSLLPTIRVVVALGAYAWDETLRRLGGEAWTARPEQPPHAGERAVPRPVRRRAFAFAEGRSAGAGRRYHCGMKESKGGADRRLLRQVVGQFRPYRGRVLVVALLILVTSGLGVVSPLLIKVVFDRALFVPGGPNVGLLVKLVALMIAVPVVASVVGVYQSYVTNTVGQRVMRDLRARLSDHLQSLSLRFFTATRTGEIQ